MWEFGAREGVVDPGIEKIVTSADCLVNNVYSRTCGDLGLDFARRHSRWLDFGWMVVKE